MTLRLAIETPDGERRELLLEEGDVVIGRHQDNQVVLEDQRSSRRHCRLSRTPQGIVLEDLESANGTLLNEEAVARGFLRPGDEIRIGSTRISLVPSVEEAAVARESRPQDDSGTSPQPVEASPVEASLGDGKVWGALEVLEGPLEGRSIPLAGEPFRLGRSRSCELTLKDERVSATHASFRRGEEGEWRVVDLESRNGIVLNRRRVRDEAIVSADELVVGKSRFRLTVEGTVPRPKTKPGSESSRGPTKERRDRSPDRASDEALARELAFEQVDLERVLRGERWLGPLFLLGGLVLTGLLAYFVVDVTRRVLLRQDPDPHSASNFISENWSFEDPLPEGASGALPPGWQLEGEGAAISLMSEGAQFPGQRAAELRAGPSGTARLSTPLLSLGVERRFLVEGFVENRGAYWAALEVEWIEETVEGSRRIGRDFAEAVRDRGGVVDAYEELLAPSLATHARVSCRVEGSGGRALFDRIAFSSLEAVEGAALAATSDAEDAGSADSGAVDSGDPSEARQEQGLAAASFTVGEEASELVLTASSRGWCALGAAATRARVLDRIWGGLSADRDPEAQGPALAPVARKAGDRGALLASTTVPDRVAERWVPIELRARGGVREAELRWRLAISEAVVEGEPRPELSVYFASRRPDQPLLLHGAESRATTFREASGEAVEEIVLGRDATRVSLLFAEPVRLEGREHPSIAGAWLLLASPSAEATRPDRLELRLVPGSRSESQAARALLDEARLLYESGQARSARSVLRRLAKEYPEEEREIARSAALLAEWDRAAQEVVERLESEAEGLGERPSPVVLRSLRTRVLGASARLEGTPEGGRLDALVARLDQAMEGTSAARAAELRARGLERARRLAAEGRFALAELVLRAALEAEGAESDEVLQREAARLRSRGESARELEVIQILKRR